MSPLYLLKKKKTSSRFPCQYFLNTEWQMWADRSLNNLKVKLWTGKSALPKHVGKVEQALAGPPV